MIGRVLWRSFWSWWDNLSYSLMTALVGAMNPSFLILVPTVAFLLTTDISFLQKNWEFWMMVLCTTVGGMWLWPLSLVSHRMHEEMINNGIHGYFKRLWVMIRESFLPGLMWWAFGTLIGGLLGLSFLFYGRFLLTFPVFFWIMLFVSLWFFMFWMMAEMILVILIYRSGLKAREMILLAFYIALRYAFVYLVLLGISWALYGVLIIPTVNPITMVIPLVTIYGIGPVIHIWAFRYAFEEMPPEGKKRSVWELFTPFVQLFHVVRRLFGGK